MSVRNTLRGSGGGTGGGGGGGGGATINPPTSFAAAEDSASQITLTWTDGVDGLMDSLLIEVSTDNATWASEAVVAAGVETYVDTNLSDDTQYYYRAVAVDQDPVGISTSVTADATTDALSIVSTNLVVHLDAEVTYNTGTGLWEDQTAQGNDLSLGTGSAPTVISSWSNGKDALQVTSANLRNTSLSGVSNLFRSGSSSYGGAFFVVGELTATDNQAPVSFGVVNGFFMCEEVSGQMRIIIDGTGSPGSANLGSYTANTPFVLGVRLINTSYRARFNAIAAQTGTVSGGTVPSMTRLDVGRLGGANTLKVARILVYTGVALSDADIETNMSALGGEYGITVT